MFNVKGHSFHGYGQRSGYYRNYGLHQTWIYCALRHNYNPVYWQTLHKGGGQGETGVVWVWVSCEVVIDKVRLPKNTEEVGDQAAVYPGWRGKPEASTLCCVC